MEDETREFSTGRKHAGLLVTGAEGKTAFYHSSSSNANSLFKKENYSSVADFEKDFVYSFFYYQELYYSNLNELGLSNSR